MALAFQRFFIPAVRITVPGFTLENLDGQGLRILWSIHRDNTNKPDEGIVTIYGLSETLSGAIFKTWQALDAGGVGAGMLLDLSIGYDKLPSRVFLGDVWDMVPADRSEANETRTIFHLGDGSRVLRDSTVGRDFHTVKVEIALRFLVEPPPAQADAGGGGLGLIYPPETAALVKTAQAELPLQTFGNIPRGMNTRDAIDMIMATLGLTWRVHNGEFIALRGGAINRPGPVLSPGSGLIDYTPRSEGGVEANALARPDMEPGVQFFVQDNNGRAFAEPFYRCGSVDFQGDTKGDSTMSVIGAKGRAA